MARWGQPIPPERAHELRLAADAAGEPRCWAEALARLSDVLSRAIEETNRE